MPTHFSSSGTQQAAEKVAEELGVPFVVLSIEEAFAREIEAAKKMLQPGEILPPVAFQNIQARLRAQRMWNWSNGAGGLFLQTGNMSEKAVGYTTVGGDLMGALAPIANLPKTVVIHLLNYLLDVMGLTGIRDTLTIPASAELAPEQEDEKDLMPFPVLDACIHLYVGEKMSSEDMKLILVQMFQEHQNQINDWVDKFVRLFHQNIFKWVQSPLSLHLGALDLERERALQLPVVSRL
jgi:NAD+ synthase (glutamine-hydrolysing)